MKGLDTNILVRHLVRDDPEQTRHAHRFITQELTRENPGFINRVVLAELVWVLQSGYEYPKAAIIEVLENVLRTSQFFIEDLAAARSALRLYQEKNADFADCLVGVLNHDSGCDRTVTFDRAAARLDEFELLPL